MLVVREVSLAAQICYEQRCWLFKMQTLKTGLRLWLSCWSRLASGQRGGAPNAKLLLKGPEGALHGSSHYHWCVNACVNEWMRGFYQELWAP